MARRYVGLAWLALLGASIASPALGDDPPGKSNILGDTEARIRLAKQSLSSTVESALSKAGKLPADVALVVLQTVEKEVKDANYLTSEERKTYLDQLSAKRKSLNAGASAPAAKANVRPPSKDELEESERIRGEINAIKALEKQGQGAVARARLKALQDKYPNHPTLMAFSAVNARQQMNDDQNRISKDRRNSEGSAFTDIDRSSGNVPPNGSISYDPKVWEKAGKRAPFGDVYTRLTGREKEYLKVLDQVTKTDFNLNETGFDQVLKMLEKELGFPLIISKATMDEVRITYESKLTYQIPRNVSKRTLLKSVLAELGLTYIIKGELVQVVSFVQAKNEHRVGVISVASMMRPGSNVDDLIKLIKATVEPDSWDTSGGTGTITFQQPGALIIKNSAEVIYQLGGRPK